ncbi:MAG: hypothetical protein JO308_18035, partial [Verrucomicrobia bacterium]|nr:hypothetical protein [Verrucomicrobiota bacterium]
MKVRLFLVLIWAFCSIGAKAQTSINLSRDLVQLGIASQNLSPDNPSLDARPLFQAALAYASNHGTQLITLDRGSYYFLTGETAGAYLRFATISDLTVNLADSTIYFADAFRQGFSLTDCQRVTLTNFTIDILKPPYTCVRLTSVNPSQRFLVYSLLPNWTDPMTFSGSVAVGTPL